MKSETVKQQVERFCRSHGLSVNGKHGVPMLSNKGATWIDCFDSWQQAKDFLTKASFAYSNCNTPYPWQK